MRHTSSRSPSGWPARPTFSSSLSSAIENRRRGNASFDSLDFPDHDDPFINREVCDHTYLQACGLDAAAPKNLSNQELQTQLPHIAQPLLALENDDLWYPSETNSYDDPPWNHSRGLAPQAGLDGGPYHPHMSSESTTPEGAGRIIFQETMGAGYNKDALCIPTTNVQYTHALLAPDRASQSLSSSHDDNFDSFSVTNAQPFHNSRSSSYSRNSFSGPKFTLPLGSSHSPVEEAVEESEDVMFLMDTVGESRSLYQDAAAQNQFGQTCEPGREDDMSDFTSQRLEYDAPFDDASNEPMWLKREHMLDQFNLACQNGHDMGLLTSSYDNEIANAVAGQTPGVLWTSDRYEADVASSFPPTSHHFPPHLDLQYPPLAPDISPTNRRRGATVGGTGPIPCPPRRTKHPNRNGTEARALVRRSRGNSSVGNANEMPMVRHGSQRGIRSRPLGEVKAQATQLKRVGRTVCSMCRFRRVDCVRVRADSQERCKACGERNEPCERADFASMSALQTCNLIFQTSCTHVTLDAQDQITIPYQPLIDLAELYSRISSYRSAFKVGVVTICGAQWDLDLDRFANCLDKIRASESHVNVTLDDILLNRRLMLSDWHSCINGRLGDVFEDFFEYTKMPNRNAYYRVSRFQADRRIFNVEDAHERQIIETMTQACRIILRALETAAFRILQKDLNEVNRSPKTISAEQRANEIENVIYRVGRLLGTLRWRIAYWQFHTIGKMSTDVIDRVIKLTRILYFWFFIARSRLESSRAQELPTGVENIYANAVPIFDEFPETNTSEGFEAWLSKGHQLVREIGHVI